MSESAKMLNGSAGIEQSRLL
jgi:predicted RNase H-like HicB family nuclease